jgi:hypothetical protein
LNGAAGFAGGWFDESGAMLRTVWLGVSCLICISVLFALKLSLGAPVKEQAAIAPAATVGTSPERQPLAKADRLDAGYNDLPKKIAVDTIKVEPVEPAPKPEPKRVEKTTRIISRHWHEGDATPTTRSAHHTARRARHHS